MLGTRILGGNVTKYRFVTVCKHCGWVCDAEEIDPHDSPAS